MFTPIATTKPSGKNADKEDPNSAKREMPNTKIGRWGNSERIEKEFKQIQLIFKTFREEHPEHTQDAGKDTISAESKLQLSIKLASLILGKPDWSNLSVEDQIRKATRGYKLKLVNFHSDRNKDTETDELYKQLSNEKSYLHGTLPEPVLKQQPNKDPELITIEEDADIVIVGEVINNSNNKRREASSSTRNKKRKPTKKESKHSRAHDCSTSNQSNNRSDRDNTNHRDTWQFHHHKRYLNGDRKPSPRNWGHYSWKSCSTSNQSNNRSDRDNTNHRDTWQFHHHKRYLNGDRKPSPRNWGHYSWKSNIRFPTNRTCY